MRAWLKLFRVPNLFTVPGDPMVGYLLANGWELDRGLPLTIGASLCFYGAGLVMNDLADVEEDRRDRPDRPLPSGAVARGSAALATGLLCFAGLGLLLITGHPSAVWCGVALMAAIALYNFVTKGWPVVGALNMGLCRSLSIMLGASVGFRAEWRMALLAAVGFGLYIAAVTNLARHETKPRAPWPARVLPFVGTCLVAAAGLSYAIDAPDRLPAAALYVVAIVVVGWLLIRMFRGPVPLPPLIGAHIRALLIFQAATCYLAEPTEIGRYCAIGLLLCWPLSRWFGRWFYAS